MENTSYISKISYTIEMYLNQGKGLNYIKEHIESAQKDGDFPQNLKLINAYYDKEYGSSACAFLDTNTGETIVGFAGTNLNNGVSDLINDVKTDAIDLGVTGITKDSEYLKEANEFIEDLREKGYNITQTTGHSLGGALSVYASIYYDIPEAVTYNGAPLYVSYYSLESVRESLYKEIINDTLDYANNKNTGSLLSNGVRLALLVKIDAYLKNKNNNSSYTDFIGNYMKVDTSGLPKSNIEMLYESIEETFESRKANLQEIDEAIANYDGRVIRFVSSKDWLNGGMAYVNGYYIGEEFLIDNGQSHGIEFFLDNEEQKYISNLMSLIREWNDKDLSVDFDGDGVIDLSLTDTDLSVKNLFSEGGLYNESVENINIDPKALYNLSTNLKTSMAESDIGWINDAIKLCNDKMML